MKTESAFLDWFTSQHGGRTKRGDSRADERLLEEITRGRRAEYELEARRLWDARRQSALYAWTARDEK